MSRKLFRHPVGIFPTGARWYLACTAMLSLLCLAMHFAIQNQAQIDAEKVVQEWGEKAGVQVAGVHYHLLRNALILTEITISREDEHVAIPHLLLRANLRRLDGPNPQIGEVEIAGLEARLSFDGVDRLWRQDERLKRLWQAARQIKLENGVVTLLPRKESAQPLTLAGLSLRQRIQNQRRSVTAFAQLATGDIHWQWQSGGDEGSEESGRMGWRRVNAGLIAASLGLRPTDGELQGYVSWRAHGSEPLDIEGRAEFIGEGRAPGLLQWQAKEVADAWQVDATATDWPIDAWSESLPPIASRTLISGELTAPLLWQGRPGEWQLSSARGELNNLIYGAPEESDTQPWRWQRLTFESARLIPAQHQLSTGNILLTGAEIILEPQKQTVNGTEVAEQAWELTIGDIRTEELTLALQLERGRLEAQALEGNCRLAADGTLSFDLNSRTESSPDENDLSGKEPPFWQLNGHVKEGKSAPAKARFDLLARQLPVYHLRPLIPLEAASGKPLALEGNTEELRLAIEVNDGFWQATGEATASALRLAHAGDVLEADQLAVQFGPVGMGLPTQKISQLDVREWRYLTVLDPLPQQQPEREARQERVRQTPPWWTTMLREQNWRIDTAIWLGGSVSVGHADSRWAEDLDLQLNRLEVGEWANLQMRGKIGDGAFAASGAWDALSLSSRFKGEASLSNALPFFLRNWMNISGMPPPLRGRLSARLAVSETEAPGGYHAVANIGLKRGLTRLGVFPNDPMLSRIDYNTNDALMLLTDAKGNAELNFETSGDWQESPLTLGRLGHAMQSAIQQRIKAREQQEYSPATADANGESLFKVQIRLHDDNTLSLNERARLHKALRVLRGGKGRVIDLVPRWGGEALNAELIARIKNTQYLIEKYLTYRGVVKERIFPQWPTVENQVKEIGSISLVVRRLRQPSRE